MTTLPSRYKFERDRHIRYFAHSLRHLPSAYSNVDTNRVTLVHFAVQSLDLLGALDDDALFEQFNIDKAAIIEWIYSLQTLPDTPSDGTKYANHVGFKGGTFLGASSFHGAAPLDHGHGDDYYKGWEYDHAHIAMTYTAICTLNALGDDLARVRRTDIIKAMKCLQRDEDGSFQCISVGSEHDMRFLYCACAISHMLDDWSGVNVQRAIQYIKNCRSYDGAIGLIPGQEGHGGSTFCAVASLALMGRLDEVLDEEDGWRNELIRWCVSRQVGGMQGRPNKDEDTCYSYWIGGTLRLLGCDYLLDQKALRQFILSCQTEMGGFGKVRGAYPDLLHSFYSVAWLSLSMGKEDEVEESTARDDDGDETGDDLQLNEMDCALGIRRFHFVF